MSRFDSCLSIKQILQGRRTDGNYLRKFYLIPSFAALVFCVDITTACYNDFAKVTCDWSYRRRAILNKQVNKTLHHSSATKSFEISPPPQSHIFLPSNRFQRSGVFSLSRLIKKYKGCKRV